MALARLDRLLSAVAAHVGDSGMVQSLEKLLCGKGSVPYPLNNLCIGDASGMRGACTSRIFLIASKKALTAQYFYTVLIKRTYKQDERACFFVYVLTLESYP